MKSKKSKRKLAPLCRDLGLEDGTDPKEFFRTRFQKKKNYKAQQVSKEAERTLHLIFNSEKAGPLLQAINLLYVEPMPNSSHLIVVVSPNSSSSEYSEFEILSSLQQMVGWLRMELGVVLHRRRVPELSFRVLPFQI